jgi:hypothetical protein
MREDVLNPDVIIPLLYTCGGAVHFNVYPTPLRRMGSRGIAPPFLTSSIGGSDWSASFYFN